jgi:AcrR family transcriptional regulator
VTGGATVRPCVYSVNIRGHNAGVAHGYHHGDLRAALIDAALRALDRQGALPSWRTLARACRVSHAAPYRHFASLEDLEAAVIEECFRRLERFLERALRGVADPVARLGEGIRAYLRFARRHPHWYGLMFGRIVDLKRYPAAAQAGQDAYGILWRAVRDCGVRDPGAVSFVLWASHHGMADLFRRDLRAGVRAAERQLVDGLVEMSLAYARAQSARR